MRLAGGNPAIPHFNLKVTNLLLTTITFLIELEMFGQSFWLCQMLRVNMQGDPIRLR